MEFFSYFQCFQRFPEPVGTLSDTTAWKKVKSQGHNHCVAVWSTWSEDCSSNKLHYYCLVNGVLHVFLHVLLYSMKKIEPRHDKTNKMSVRPAKTQISLGIRPVWSVFAVRMKKAWVLSYPLSAQRRLWSDWADAQADLSLHWAHTHFVGFVMRRLT